MHSLRQNVTHSTKNPAVSRGHIFQRLTDDRCADVENAEIIRNKQKQNKKQTNRQKTQMYHFLYLPLKIDFPLPD